MGMEVEILGSGTSTGVPCLGCSCEVCRSEDERDRRLRTSAIVRTDGASLLIDCGPDFRTQMLRATRQELDALLLTHSHYDHVGGIDDLRAYCRRGAFPVYAQPNVIADLKARMPYCFVEHPYPGVPQLEVHELDDREFEVAGVKVLPLPVLHYRLPVFGYRIGPMAYVTDVNHIPDSTLERMHGLEVLIIDALRQTRHLSHFSLPETLSVVRKLQPRRTCLIHMSDGMGLHADVSEKLPPGVELCYDGMLIKV